MLTEVKLTLSAIALESGAIALLSTQSHSNMMLGGFFLLHGMASVLITPAVWFFMPARYHEPKLTVMLLLFSLCFFIPVLGLLGFVIAEIIALLLPSLPTIFKFSSVTMPTYQPTFADYVNKSQQSRHGQTHEQLKNQNLPLDLRMKALLTIQQKPTRYTAHLLRDTLGENAEDLRLLAYGILSSKEKVISERIHIVLDQFKAAKEQQDIEASFTAARELAELYWELVYQNLVQGGMLSYALEQVRFYVAQAIQWRESDAGLRVLSGRVHLLVGNLDLATTSFSDAVDLGLPPANVSSYLAELAFLKRDFSYIRNIMHQDQIEIHLPRSSHIVNYWN
jgi:hypothetical protein